MSRQVEQELINQNNHLMIGGVDSVKLANDYGTPLVVYDVHKIKKQLNLFKQAFEKNNVDYVISYASKAFSCIAMYQLLKNEKVHSDVVSGGELYVAHKADFPMNNISFHGNNKTYQELSMAVDYQVGLIIVDNFNEIDLLNQILEEKNQTINVLMRVTPGVEAHTHEYISTGQTDSKFGFDLESGQVEQAFKLLNKSKRINLKGIHAHIGSQIFAYEGFEQEIKVLIDVLANWKKESNFDADILNLGGGFGIKYTADDQPISIDQVIQKITAEIKIQTKEQEIKMPSIWIEPGRSIVGEAGYSLYRTGSTKSVPNGHNYVAVDGGMGDNIRPALYQAKYEASLANRINEKDEKTYELVGKYCESGDILIHDLKLPIPNLNDLVVVYDTGAYGYSMASNYNLNLKPAVVFVENGKSQLVIKRQSFEDLVSLDLSL
ncbi:diaminopimelate decarboxylase [Lactobacillus sp. S2-2]|uniref:diaminopimelate decarboxylase n=1 Tax=Lactobacillus sp. S2-2 TaxID=2692917 RepID=UPI001EFFB8B8|nr:diaminopimelate decarboxylase [Lactobacillus sp. S2-2]MCF6514922.1 diaminopimelate decarboxylase [Lactobacillus sp. S2-2]